MCHGRSDASDRKRSKERPKPPRECRYYKRVPRAAATRCWGLLLCLGLALPVGAQQTAHERAGRSHAAGDASRRTADAHTDSDSDARRRRTPSAGANRSATRGPLTLVVHRRPAARERRHAAARRTLARRPARRSGTRRSRRRARPRRAIICVFVPSSGQLSALDETTGAIKWQDALPSPVVSAALARGLAHRRRRSRAPRATAASMARGSGTLPLPAAVTDAARHRRRFACS